MTWLYHAKFRKLLPVLNVLPDNKEVGFDKSFNHFAVSLLTGRESACNRYRLQEKIKTNLFKCLQVDFI